MASVDKVKVGSTSYDISPSKDGTLNGFTSNDAASPSSWTATDVVAASDSNSTIFSKITTMIKNVRWLYSKLGTTDFSATGQSTVTGALSALQTGLNGKAASSHSHTTAQLPVSSSQTNSNSYIPTSALVYSMQQQITSLNDAMIDINYHLDPPNERDYSDTSLGTWNSVSDVDTFFNRFNYNNGYKDGDTKLSLGNYIAIQDGTYNAQWMIAGFDMESNQKAADGTRYNNGYGICLVPKTHVMSGNWNSRLTTSGGYINSLVHTETLNNVTANLKNILGSHIVNRNVLLGYAESSGYSTGYTWTTAYATLMSVGQMTGTFAANGNKYDDGEANYKLPVFNFTGFKTGYYFWTRAVGKNVYAYYVDSNGGISYGSDVGAIFYIRPMIYVR